MSDLIFSIKNCNDYLQPIVSALPVQLLAYHVACFKGTDVDQQRNLENQSNKDRYTSEQDELHSIIKSLYDKGLGIEE